jgi:hypothetical protein
VIRAQLPGAGASLCSSCRYQASRDPGRPGRHANHPHLPRRRALCHVPLWQLPARAQFDAGRSCAVDLYHGCFLEDDRDPAGRRPPLVLLQVLIQASWRTVVGVEAADRHPVPPAQEIGYLFENMPWQRRPPLLLTQQEDKVICGEWGKAEVAATGGGRKYVARRDRAPDRILDDACHAASMAHLQKDVDAHSSRPLRGTRELGARALYQFLICGGSDWCALSG